MAANTLLSLSRLQKVQTNSIDRLKDEKIVLENQFKLLKEFVNIHEIRLGYDHPETADAQSKLAIAYQETGRYTAAAPWMRRAFCTFFKIFGPNDGLTQACY